MSWLARVVAPGVANQVSERGNGRMAAFFTDDDRRACLDLLRESGEKHGLAYWGYCLISNHVHPIVVPKIEDILALRDKSQELPSPSTFRERGRGAQASVAIRPVFS